VVVIEGLWLFLNILILWYLCGGLVVELSDKVKEFIVKTIKEEILRILPLTVVTKEDLRLAIESMDKRFEDLQKYMDKRFEAVNERFEGLQRYMDRRFEAVNKRFEAVDRRFEDMNRRFEDMFRTFRIMFVIISLLIAVFGFLGIYVG